MNLLSEKTKICYECKVEKPLNCYNKAIKNGDGFAYRCKSCYNGHLFSLRVQKRLNEFKKSVPSNEFEVSFR